MIKLTKKQLNDVQNEVYARAKQDAYFGNEFDGFSAGVDFALKQVNELLIQNVCNSIDDLTYSLYGQVVDLNEKVKKLEFMIENGLVEENK